MSASDVGSVRGGVSQGGESRGLGPGSRGADLRGADLRGAGAGGAVVCCGLVTLDVLQEVERLPAPDEKVVATALDVTFGGPAANAAATAVALGARAVLVTALGVGLVADLVRRALADAGVELVDLLDGAPATPAVSTVLVTRTTGERAVVSVNATGVGDLARAARRIAAEVLDGAGVLLVDGHHLGAAVELAGRARARGVPVVLDGGSWKPGLEALLPDVDHAVLSADFRVPADARSDDPDAVDDLSAVARLGARDVARSAGGHPVRYLLADGTRGAVEPDAVPAGALVDTLGAGDVLHGALAVHVARGDDLVAALVAGVRAATTSTRFRGARGWVTSQHDHPGAG